MAPLQRDARPVESPVVTWLRGLLPASLTIPPKEQ